MTGINKYIFLFFSMICFNLNIFAQSVDCKGVCKNTRVVSQNSFPTPDDHRFTLDSKTGDVLDATHGLTIHLCDCIKFLNEDVIPHNVYTGGTDAAGKRLFKIIIQKPGDSDTTLPFNEVINPTNTANPKGIAVQCAIHTGMKFPLIVAP